MGRISQGLPLAGSSRRSSRNRSERPTVTTEAARSASVAAAGARRGRRRPYCSDGSDALGGGGGRWRWVAVAVDRGLVGGGSGGARVRGAKRSSEIGPKPNPCPKSDHVTRHGCVRGRGGGTVRATGGRSRMTHDAAGSGVPMGLHGHGGLTSRPHATCTMCASSSSRECTVVRPNVQRRAAARGSAGASPANAEPPGRERRGCRAASTRRSSQERRLSRAARARSRHRI